MKKWLTHSMGLVMVMSVFAGCSSKTETAATVSPAAQSTAAATTTAAQATTKPEDKISGKITFLNHRTDIAETKMKDYIAAFKKLYPNADVENEAVKDESNIVKVRAASQQLPDVVFVGGDAMKPQNYPDYFVPLDDLGLNGKVYFEDSFKVNGKLYGISSGGSITGVLYNKKAFESAGITSVPKTLDEFYADCEKLKSKGIVPVATNFKDKWPLSQYEVLAQSIAGDALIMDKLAVSDAPFTLDSSYGKALTILRTLADKKYTESDLFSTNWEASKKDLATGKFAMAVLGNWAIPQIIENGAQPDDIGFFPMPVDNNGTLVSPIGSDAALVVSKTSKNIETAKAFVKFFIEQSGYANDSGFVPPIKSEQPKLKQLADFMNGTKMLESSPTKDYTNQVSNKAQFAFPDLAQEFMTTKDQQSVLDKFNKKWAAARKTVTQ
ncbi:ABC transporter substrate-binding protein [Paenibacillus pectinilyticus]|nr:extracellular solute-binding protein [Paenibacillus pectinilyticus]